MRDGVVAQFLKNGLEMRLTNFRRGGDLRRPQGRMTMPNTKTLTTEPPPRNLKPLPREFYEPPADVVAPRLLGHWLVRNLPGGVCAGVIVEVEAYLTGDPASHSFRGPTRRNQIMWGPPGYAYVYFIYGNHWCVNAVCQPPTVAEAVLIRAVEPKFGLEGMRARRELADERQMTNGPGKLCAALGIDGGLDGADLCSAGSPLFIAENPDVETFLRERGPMITSARIGIVKAAELPLRFYLARSRYLSRRPARVAGTK